MIAEIGLTETAAAAIAVVSSGDCIWVIWSTQKLIWSESS